MGPDCSLGEPWKQLNIYKETFVMSDWPQMTDLHLVSHDSPVFLCKIGRFRFKAEFEKNEEKLTVVLLVWRVCLWMRNTSPSGTGMDPAHNALTIWEINQGFLKQVFSPQVDSANVDQPFVIIIIIMIHICPPFKCTETNAAKWFCNHDPVGLQPPIKGLFPQCELEDNYYPTHSSTTLLSFTPF